MHIFRAFPLALVLGLASAEAATACPWAGNTYRATVPPDITIEVTFNSKCTTLRLIDSGGTARNLPLSASGKGWTAKYDTTTITFDNKGKRANGTRGGARRSLKLKKL